MEENKVREAKFRLVAQVRGGRLTIEASLLDELKAEHLCTIRAIAAGGGSLDRCAWAESVEWERLANFMRSAERCEEAVRAYREAASSCLEGTYYDYGSVHYPSRRLRARFLELFDRAMAYCGDDPHLRELLFEDEFLREMYGELRGLDRP